MSIRDVGQDWARQYRLFAHNFQHLPLTGLDRAGVAAVLRAAGPAARAVAEKPSELDEVARVAAYPADPTLGADPFYVRVLAEDLASGNLRPERIADQPPDIGRYLDTWWESIKQLAGNTPTRDLFGTLTAALGPIGRDDLEHINPSLVDDWAADKFDDVLRRVRRYVLRDPEGGYVLAHPRLRDYLCTRIKLEAYRDKVVDYCARWRDHKSQYALNFFARHLKAARRTEDLYELIGKEWMQARRFQAQGDLGFARDVQLMIDMASAEQQACIVQQFRGSFILATFAGRARAAQWDIVELLARAGRDVRATNLATLLSDPDNRSRALIRIATVVHERGEHDRSSSILAEALRSADAITDDRRKTAALGTVARAFAVSGDRQRAATATADALTIIKRLNNNWDTPGRAIEAVAQALAKTADIDGLQRLRAAAGAINRSADRARALASVATALAAVGDRDAVNVGRMALDAAAATPNNQYPEEALGFVSSALVATGDQAGLQSLPKIAEQITDAAHRDAALRTIAPVLATTGDPDGAVSVSHMVANESIRVSTLAAVAKALVASGQHEAAAESAHRALAMFVSMDRTGAGKPEWILVSVSATLAIVRDLTGWRQVIAAVESLTPLQRANVLPALARDCAAVGEFQDMEQVSSVGATIVEHAENRVNNLDQDPQPEDLTHFEQAETLVDTDRNRIRRDSAEAIASVAEALAIIGASDKARITAGRALAIAELVTDGFNGTRVMAAVAETLLAIGDPDGAVAAAEKALTRGELGERDSGLTEALVAVTQAMAYRADRAGLDQVRRAIGAVTDIDDRKRVLRVLAPAWAASGRSQEASSVLAMLTDPVDQAETLCAMAEAFASAAYSGEALTAAHHALAIANDRTDEWEQARAMAAAARALFAAGEREAGLNALETAGELEQLLDVIVRVAPVLEPSDRTRLAMVIQGALASIRSNMDADGDFVKSSASDEQGPASVMQMGVRLSLRPSESAALIEAMAALGDSQGVEVVAQQAVDIAERAVDEHDLAVALEALAPALAASGNRAILDRLRADATTIVDDGWRTSAMRAVAAAFAKIGDWEAALSATDSMKRVEDRAAALAAVAQELAATEHHEKALVAVRHALAAAEGIRNARVRSRQIGKVAEVLPQVGQFEQAAETWYSQLDAASLADRETMFQSLATKARILAPKECAGAPDRHA